VRNGRTSKKICDILPETEKKEKLAFAAVIHNQPLL
jgi:hypothetical protein